MSAKGWTDLDGVSWDIPSSKTPLMFQTRSQRALRSHVFRRDGFKCQKCGIWPWDLPEDYDGSEAVIWRDNGRVYILQVGFIVPRRAGGEAIPANLHAICDLCCSHKSRVTRRRIEYLSKSMMI